MGWDDFWDSVKDAAEDAYSWTKGAVKDVYNDGVKPVIREGMKEIVAPVVGTIYKVAKPVVDAGGRIITKIDRAAENTLDGFGNLTQNIGNLLGNQWFVLFGIGLASYVIIKLVNKEQ